MNATQREMVDVSRRLSRRLQVICSNRAELFALELQEVRQRILSTWLMALGLVALGLLTAISISAAIVLALWNTSPVSVLVVLGCLYALAAALLHRVLLRRLASWQSFPASLHELRKDAATVSELFA
ncbi:MAG: phage holin family protein [Planctomycetota bacterium]|jgi:uncharacterized membrane protein YqjE|nr:phage holin family protein [Planctomycetota bacterium]